MKVTNLQEATMFVFTEFTQLKGWPFATEAVYIDETGHVYLDFDEAVNKVGPKFQVLSRHIYANILGYNGLDINAIQFDRMAYASHVAVKATRERFIEDAIKELEEGGEFTVVMDELKKFLEPTFFLHRSDGARRTNQLLGRLYDSKPNVSSSVTDALARLREIAEYKKSILRPSDDEDKNHCGTFNEALIKAVGHEAHINETWDKLYQKGKENGTPERLA